MRAYCSFTILVWHLYSWLSLFWCLPEVQGEALFLDLVPLALFHLTGVEDIRSKLFPQLQKAKLHALVSSLGGEKGSFLTEEIQPNLQSGLGTATSFVFLNDWYIYTTFSEGTLTPQESFLGQISEPRFHTGITALTRQLTPNQNHLCLTTQWDNLEGVSKAVLLKNRNTFLFQSKWKNIYK
jgi:hypothetical protein